MSRWHTSRRPWGKSEEGGDPPFGFCRRGYHHGNLKEALLAAARLLTAERGPQGFTVAEAARLAGVSASAPYRHFKDRDALLADLARRGFEVFAGRLREAATGRDAREGLSAMGRAYLAFAREEPGYYAAMFGWNNPCRVEDSGAFDALRNAVARLLPEGTPPDPVQLMAMEVWAVAHGLAGLERAGGFGAGDPPPEHVLADAVGRLFQVT
jgi:AcrR family transcriptional regulator